MDCSDLRVAVSMPDGVVTVALVGEADFSSAGVMGGALEQAVRAEPPLVVVDLSQLSFMDSSGIKCLVRAYAEGEAVGCRVVARNANGIVRRVLELAGVADLLSGAPDITTAG